jgi:hypothetical protein
MINKDKQRPVIDPEDRGSLAETVQLGIEQSSFAPDLHVALVISGGVPSQMYQLEFDVAGTGDVMSRLQSDLARHGPKSARTRLDRGDVVRLFRTILKSGILDTAPEPPGFLPDTVVGRLEILDRRELYRSYFAADADQAEVQGRMPPRPLQMVVEEVYRLAAKLLGVRSVRP